MALLGFELLFRLLWGLLVGVIFVRRTESSEKFVKIAARFSWGIGIVSAGLLYVADLPLTATGESAEKLPILLSLAAVVLGFQMYASIMAIWGRMLGFLLIVLAPLFLIASGAIYESNMFEGIFNLYSSGLLLGGFFAGQFLGHWYLNVPGMHIVELKRIITFLFVGLSFKTIEVVVTLVRRYLGEGIAMGIDAMGRPLGDDVSNTEFLLQLNPSHSVFSFEGDLWLGLGSYGLILLSMRVIWGLLAPWILALMIRKTVNMRSTQSATGILYAACVMVLVAEATALYLGQVLGINL